MPCKVYEQQPTLPNNHTAVLRFRTPHVGDMVGIPFRKVRMVKSAAVWLNPVADGLAYSRKTTGTNTTQRSISEVSTTEHRWIAPEDLVARLAQGVDVQYGAEFDFNCGLPTISTIPMPALMLALNYAETPVFHYTHGFNVTARLHNTDAYATLYVPQPDHAFNRVSITGNQLIMEYSFPMESTEEVEKRKARDMRHIFDQDIAEAMALLGLPLPLATFPEITVQRYSKILPIDEDVRKRFIAHATDHFKIYSLGRYATWRPGMLLDDLVQDVTRIRGWLSGGSSVYELRKARSG
jgi:hypothetical protein